MRKIWLTVEDAIERIGVRAPRYGDRYIVGKVEEQAHRRSSRAAKALISAHARDSYLLLRIVEVQA